MTILLFIRDFIPTILLTIICIRGWLTFRYADKAHKFVVIHLITALCIELSSLMLATFSIPNTFLFHFYVLEEFILVSLFYLYTFRSGYMAKVITMFLVVFPLFSVIDSLFIQDESVFNSYSKSVEALLLLFYAVIGFGSVHAGDTKTPVPRMPFFWINSAILFYFSVSLFLFYLSNLLLKNYSEQLNDIVWRGHYLAAIVYYLIIGIGIWKLKTATK